MCICKMRVLFIVNRAMCALVRVKMESMVFNARRTASVTMAHCVTTLLESVLARQDIRENL